MELRKSFDVRKILVGLYFAIVAVFLAVGFMPAEATAQYEMAGEVVIPAIQLKSEVAKLKLKDGRLDTPERIVGSFSKHQNKTLLIGHASTVFNKLQDVKVGDIIMYNGVTYTVKDAEVVEKEEIDMREILRAGVKDTLVVMTCAGKALEGMDATHRLIVTAENLS